MKPVYLISLTHLYTLMYQNWFANHIILVVQFIKGFKNVSLLRIGWHWSYLGLLQKCWIIRITMFTIISATILAIVPTKIWTKQFVMNFLTLPCLAVIFIFITLNFKILQPYVYRHISQISSFKKFQHTVNL